MVTLITPALSHAQINQQSPDFTPSLHRISPGVFPSWLSEESILSAIHDRPENAPYRYSATGMQNHGVAQGWTVTVDTRDAVACRKVYNSIKNFQNLTDTAASAAEACRYDRKNPAVTFFVFQDESGSEFRTKLNDNFIKSTDQNIQNSTRNIGIAMLATMGVLWMMPESSTGWDREKIKKHNGVFGIYSENVTAGPVMDKDDLKYNLIGHPISGAAYYIMARHSGLTEMQSFGYSVAMSTFFWEYGFEAFAEIPSIQDIIITPVIGSLLGHVLYTMEQRLDENEGRIFGSERLGKAVKVIINPMGTLSNAINSMLSHRVIQNSTSEIYIRNPSRDQSGNETNGMLGFRTVFVF